MTPISTNDYKQAELLVMRRDAERRWRTHAKVFMTGAIILVLVGLVSSHVVVTAVAALVWLAALGAHYLVAIRWFERSKSEFQGRVEFLAQRRRLTETG
jgi:hypothetical protein